MDTARFFTLTPPLFLRSSRRVGFGIERLVADFSDNVTPPEILEQFGIGDDFNGFWLPLIRLFIAPGRTTGLALSARGKDLLFDFDKGFSGELALDILNRGGKLDVTPLFFRPNAAAPIDFKRGEIVRNPDGSTVVSGGDVTIPGAGELHLSIRGSISPYNVVVKLDGTTIAADVSAGANRPKWLIAADAKGVLSISVTDKGAKNSWLETIAVSHVDVPGPKPPTEPEFDIVFQEGAGNDAGFRIQLVPEESVGRNLVLRLTPSSPKPTLKMFTQEIPAKPDGLFRMVLTPGDAPAQFSATWVSQADPLTPVPSDSLGQAQFIKTEASFARAHDLLLAVRGGGHNGGGLGSCDDGLVIDLSRMKGVRVDPERRTARVEGGCTWGDVDHTTHAFGLATPSGLFSTTGVGGLTLGGGLGYLTRKFGLSIDNLIGADMVLADGRFVTVSADEDSDLFWAIRGRGGNFGVVTSFLFRLHPVKTVVA